MTRKYDKKQRLTAYLESDSEELIPRKYGLAELIEGVGHMKNARLTSQQIETARKGRRGAVAAYLICQGDYPNSIRELETHLKKCNYCKARTKEYAEGKRKAVNKVGWWSGHRG